MSILKIENLTKTFGEKVAVNNISINIEPGEIYGFIGHNGAGKTTTIKSCLGLMSYDNGEIFIDGINVKQDPIRCKEILAYIPDNPQLYEFLTGIQYLNFVADIFKIDKETRDQRITEYTKLFGIYDDLSMPISSYSHGMKQKIAIASAFIHEPKLLIMDEPFVGLDPVASRHVKDLMRRICDNGGAVFFSTHVLEVAEKLCDKVAIIRKGNLIAQGTMEEVKGSKSLEDVFLELEGDVSYV